MNCMQDAQSQYVVYFGLRPQYGRDVRICIQVGVLKPFNSLATGERKPLFHCITRTCWRLPPIVPLRLLWQSFDSAAIEQGLEFFSPLSTPGTQAHVYDGLVLAKTHLYFTCAVCTGVSVILPNTTITQTAYNLPITCKSICIKSRALTACSLFLIPARQ